jgi:formate hydrogenlyase subunit 4
MLHAPMTGAFHGLPAAALLLVGVALFVVLLAENARIPIDDPNTHLELTMIHEVMALDHSGPLFGLVLYGAAVKLLLFSALLLHFALPFTFGEAWLDWALFAAGMLAVAVAVGLVESVMARLRLRHVPSLLIAASVLCAFGFFFTLA